MSLKHKRWFRCEICNEWFRENLFSVDDIEELKKKHCPQAFIVCTTEKP